MDAILGNGTAILAGSLPPNRGVALRNIVADIIRIVEEAGFPGRPDQIPADEMPLPQDRKIVPIPQMPRSIPDL